MLSRFSRSSIAIAALVLAAGLSPGLAQPGYWSPPAKKNDSAHSRSPGMLRLKCQTVDTTAVTIPSKRVARMTRVGLCTVTVVEGAASAAFTGQVGTRERRVRSTVTDSGYKVSRVGCCLVVPGCLLLS